MTISKATAGSNIWEAFYDALVSGVTSITLADSSTTTIQTYTSSFPDKAIDTKSVYPILVVDTPSLSWDDFTFSKKTIKGSITISVYTVTGGTEAAEKFCDKVIDTIETNRDDFRALNLYHVNLASTSYDEAMRAEMKVHVKSCIFDFKYNFTKT